LTKTRGQVLSLFEKLRNLSKGQPKKQTTEITLEEKLSYAQGVRFTYADLDMQRKFHSNIAGTSHYQDALRRCKAGERLWLLREPNNPYDTNAVSVWGQAGELIGYINRELAVDLAPQMDRGVWIEVTISELTGGTPDNPTLGCNIYLEFKQEKLPDGESP
jgi:hypothetical protein